MYFEVIRRTKQAGTVHADSPSEAITLLRPKFDRPWYAREEEYTVRELVGDGPKEAEGPVMRAGMVTAPAPEVERAR